MRRTGAIMSATVTLPILMGMNKMTNQAAVLEGAMSKFNVVFGDASDEMKDWVKEFRKEVPLATSEIVKSAAAMQDLLVPMGIARNEAKDMSKQWLTLASRLGAFNDVPVDQALEAIRSGVAGMSEPLRRFGIDARVASIEQEALSKGLMRAGEEMSEQVRQQALLSLAYRQSKDAVEGFEDQQGSLLLVKQELRAAVSDLSASLGKQLMPIVKSITQSVTGLAKGMTDMSSTGKTLTLVISGIVAAIGPLLTGLGFMVGQMRNLIPMTQKLASGIRAVATAAKLSATALSGWIGATIALGIANFKANQRTQDRIDAISDEVKQIDSVTEATKALVGVEEDITNIQKQMARGARGLGKELEDLRQKRDDLIDQRDMLASQEIQMQIQGMEQLEDAQRLINFIGTDFSTLISQSSSMDISRPFVEAKREADALLQALDMIPQGFQELSSEQILSDVGNVTFEDKIFPPGSLGAMQERLSALKDSLKEAVNPDVIARLQEKIQETTGRINEFSDNATDAGRRSAMAMGSLGTSIGGVIGKLIQGKKEALSFGNILASVAPALINVLTGGAGGFASSLASGIFGGMFHDGGIIPGGAKERMVRVRPGEGIFTQGQMRAMGSMNGGGGGISESGIQRAFDRALGKHLQKLGPEEIFTLSRKGQFSF